MQEKIRIEQVITALYNKDIGNEYLRNITQNHRILNTYALKQTCKNVIEGKAKAIFKTHIQGSVN